MSSFPALVIGVDEYDDGDSLLGVRSDVSTVTQALRRIGYTVLSTPPLAARRTTRARMMAMIERFASRAQAAGGGVFYFSGKGAAKKVGNQFEPALCPSDVVAEGPVLLNELRATLGEAAPRVVIVLDCALRGARSYGSGQQTDEVTSRLPLLAAPRFFAGDAPETQRGGHFTNALVKTLTEVTPISQASLSSSSVGVSVLSLVAATRATLSADSQPDGNPGVEIDGSTNGVYVIKTQSVPKSLVVLPPGQFLPGLHPTGFATGVEYWPEGFAWPSSFLIERAQTVSGLSASTSERYQWQTFPSATSTYPSTLPNARWHLTLETTADSPQTVGAGFLCRSDAGDYLLWFASDAALAPGGNVLRVGYSATHGTNLRLRCTSTTDSVPTGMRWVRCDRVT